MKILLTEHVFSSKNESSGKNGGQQGTMNIKSRLCMMSLRHIFLLPDFHVLK